MSPIKDQQKQFNFNSQAAIIYYIEEIISKWNSEYANKRLLPSDSRKTGTLQQANYKNFHCVRTEYELNSEPPPDISAVKQTKFFSKIGKTNEFGVLFSNIKPFLKDSIVCNVDIYKTFIIDGVEYDWKVPLNEGAFFNFSSGMQKTHFEISNERKENRDSPLGRNVAISSFSYEYKGTNDFETEVNLEAGLELKFGDPTLLLEQIDTSLADNAQRFATIPKYGGGNLGPFFCFSDLISNVSSDYNNNEINLSGYRIKAIVKFDTSLTKEQFDKWYARQSNLEKIGFKDYKTFKSVLNKSSTYLYLIPTSHDITIDQSNLLTVKINYIASNHGLLHSPDKANILDIATYEMSLLKQLTDEFNQLSKELNEKKEQSIKEKKIDGDAKDDEKKKKFEEQFKEENEDKFKQKEILERRIRIAKSSVYSGVIKQIIKDNLYRIQIPNQSLGMGKELTVEFGAGPTDETPKIEDKSVVKQTSIISKKEIKSFIKIPSPEILILLKKLSDSSIGPESFETRTLLQNINFGDFADDKDILDAKIKAIEESLKKNADLDTIDEKSDIQTISFFFLGDLLDIILECLNNINPKSSKPVLLFGNVSLKLPVNINLQVSQAKDICFNIADIPITFNLLTKFWTSLIESRPDSITVHTFFYELIERLLKPVLGPKYFELFEVANKLKIGSTTISLPNKNDKTDILTSTTPENRKGPLNSTVLIREYEKLMDSGELETLALNNGLTSYVCFYDASSTKNIQDNNGDLEKDEADGIYHFSLNVGDTIIKKISFSKIDIPGIREGLAVQEGSDKKAISLKQAYKAEIQLIPGLTVYKPGDMIFIDPYLFSNEKVAYLSNALGFVGYYLVTSARYNMSKTSIPTATISCILHAWINSEGKTISVKGN